MNGSSSNELDTYEPDELGIASDTAGSGDESKPLHSLVPSSSSAPSPKRSRRTVEKRVVTVPISEAKGAGEGAPPADSWAWRKYGQKPIKGSPYPRGYYRCSSSKGCPARKQVERSRLDPATIVVTYSFDHNHPWPLPKNHHRQTAAVAQAVEADEQPTPQPPPLQNESSPPESVEREEKFSDLISEEESALMVHAQWFPDVCSTASTTSPSAAGSSELLYGSVFFAGAGTAAALPEEREELAGSSGAMRREEEEEEEEESMFAGLGELPEYSVVLRRGLASASWVGTTG